MDSVQKKKVVVCDRSKTVTYKGQVVLPTRQEFLLIKYLEEGGERVRTSEGILEHLGMPNYDKITVNSMMKRARKCLRQLGVNPIKTRYGIGWCWMDDRAEDMSNAL